MRNVLVRGLPEEVHRQFEKIAESQNLSVNQLMVRLLIEGMKRSKAEEEKRKEWGEAIQRLKEIREENYRKYGKQEESWKLIREAREERSRRAENW